MIVIVKLTLSKIPYYCRTRYCSILINLLLVPVAAPVDELLAGVVVGVIPVPFPPPVAGTLLEQKVAELGADIFRGVVILRRRVGCVQVEPVHDLLPLGVVGGVKVLQNDLSFKSLIKPELRVIHSEHPQHIRIFGLS